ncbi:MAG: acyl-CoA synthetase [Acidimicrobiales bacterium]
MYLTQGLHRALRHTSQLPATIFGGRVRTVAEHADRVARLAGGLRSLGVYEGERVAVLSLNSDRYTELLMAVPWANGVLNPVNTRWSPEEIIYSLADSETSVLVVDDAFVPVVDQLIERCHGLQAVVHAGEGPAAGGAVGYEDLVAASASAPDARRGGDALAAILYTGGTTGSPKGVMLTHANILSSVLGGQATFPFARPGGRFLHAAPMFHGGVLAAWAAQWMVGGSHAVVPAFDPVAVMTAIEQHRATHLLLVPTMIHRLVDHPDRDSYDLSSVHGIAYGGSPIARALLRRAMETFPGADFVQVFGMTEVSIGTLLGPDDHRRGDRLGSAGQAAAHCEVRVVDDGGHEVPRGTVGEIAVQGGSVMTGYWGKPQETAAALRGGWMHTGDAGHMDQDGYLFVVDRLKDMIISGGENIYSSEVENALGLHPAVAACAVIGVPDDSWGERVHAVVVLKPGAEATLEELRRHTSGIVAGYKAPRSVEFVDALPLSGAGKVLKRELRARYTGRAERPVN